MFSIEWVFGTCFRARYSHYLPRVIMDFLLLLKKQKKQKKRNEKGKEKTKTNVTHIISLFHFQEKSNTSLAHFNLRSIPYCYICINITFSNDRALGHTFGLCHISHYTKKKKTHDPFIGLRSAD